MRIAARVFLTLFAFASTLPASRSQERTEADGWIVQLGADDYRLREAASEALGKLGVKALEPIRSALKTTDNPEIARRLEALLERLEAVRLRDAIKITLKVENRPVREVILAVAEMAGCRVRFQESPEKMLVSFNWVETPLLQVLDRICEASGYIVLPSDEEFNRLVVSKVDTSVPLSCYSGPFRISPYLVNMSRQLQIGGLPRSSLGRQVQESTSINLMIASEPKLPLVAIGNSILIKAVDDRGQSLIEGPQEGAAAQQVVFADNDVLMPSYRTYSMNFAMGLARTHREARFIKQLKGRVLTSVLLEAPQILAIDNLAEAKGKKFDCRNYVVEIGAVNSTAFPTTVELTVRRKNGSEEDMSWQQTLYGRLQFYDADGSRLQFAGTQEANNTPNSTRALVQLQRAGGRPNLRPAKPARLVFVEWITKQRVVDFDLADIPLP